MMNSELYIGLMSGTSLDGLDVALVDLSQQAKVLSAQTVTFPEDWRQRLQQLADNDAITLTEYGAAHHWLGAFSGQAVNQLLASNHVSAQQICAIGSHGQTIHHQPTGPWPFTLQLGDAAQIAAHTGITTISDFRSADMAVGGQGAPLAPAFHQAIFGRSGRAVLNLGGIANISVLADRREEVCGFDTGPANGLLDRYCQLHFNCSYDRDSTLGQQGQVQTHLLNQWLRDPYFHQPAPKSTGREYFNEQWLTRYLNDEPYPPIDVLRTLYELTAITVRDALAPFKLDELLVCGGGAHNPLLMARLTALMPHCQVQTTARYGLSPDWVEAACFAWLAKAHCNHQPGNLPTVTGAQRGVILGACYPAFVD